MESPAWELNQRLMLFELSLELFKRNYAQLRDKIDAHLPTDAIGFVKAVRNHGQIREDQIEITRLLHNFVAAVKSLVDHTRRLYDKLYKPARLMPDYPDEIKKRFAKNALAQFVEGLRNYCMHYQLPPIRSKFGMDIEKGLSSAVCLTRDELLKWDRWDKGKAFLEACPPDVPFAGIMAEYHQEVTEFYDWFVNQQRAVHATEIAFLDERRARMKELREEEARRAGMTSTFEELPLEHEEIAVAAYDIWEKDGRQHGKDKAQWEEASKQLRSRKVAIRFIADDVEITRKGKPS
jgi:hypothetical protein